MKVALTCHVKDELRRNLPALVTHRLGIVNTCQQQLEANDLIDSSNALTYEISAIFIQPVKGRKENRHFASSAAVRVHSNPS